MQVASAARKFRTDYFQLWQWWAPVSSYSARFLLLVQNLSLKKIALRVQLVAGEGTSMQELIDQSIWLKENEPLQSAFIALTAAKEMWFVFPWRWRVLGPGPVGLADEGQIPESIINGRPVLGEGEGTSCSSPKA